MKINIVKMTEWKNLYPIKKIILLSVWLFTVLILYASFVALIKDHDFRTIFIIILDSVGLVKSFIPIKKYILTNGSCQTGRDTYCIHLFSSCRLIYICLIYTYLQRFCVFIITVFF